MSLFFRCFFLAVFAAGAAVHLVSCWRGKPNSAYTKPLLVSSLTLYCLFVVPRPWMLIAALFFSWLGDVLLMPKGNKWFISGGVAFLISHVLFLFVYLPHISAGGVLWYAVIPAACVYLTASAAVIVSIRKNAPKPMLVPLFLYLAANSVMNLFALSMLTCSPCAGAALAYAGAVLFYLSDSILFLSRYHEKAERIPKRGFLIMLTYIAGEALIAFGILLMRAAG